MAGGYQQLAEPPTGVSRALCAVVLVLLIAASATGFIAGRAGGTRAFAAAPIVELDGVPVGVLHSRGGALAAADSYLLVDQQTIEQDPSRFGAVVREVFASPIQLEVLG